MSIRNLDKLFKPASVALIGASRRERSLGAIALGNLLQGGFQGAIYPVPWMGQSWCPGTAPGVWGDYLIPF